MNDLGIYIHWPFCIVKCPYCDFNSHKITNYNENDWLNAYLDQIDFLKTFCLNNFININKLSSIFFGGGTPSLMKPHVIEKIIEKALNTFGFKNNIEITLEANPSTLEFKNIKSFKEAGINRVSLGVQALNDNDLKYLGRIHKFSDITITLNQVLKVFENTSVDLIFGLPNQSLAIWEKELDKFLLNFDPQHISAYQLTIEKGTKFFNLLNNNKIEPINEETEEQFYKLTKNIVEKHHFIQYEISNFSKNNFKSVHNQLYWKSENWIGIGPGSISRLWDKDKKRYEIENFKKPSTWLKNIIFNQNKLKKIQLIDNVTSDNEILIMGLRLNEGIEIKKLTNFNLIKQKNFRQLLKKRLIKIENKKIIIENNYLIKLNAILSKIMNNQQLL